MCVEKNNFYSRTKTKAGHTLCGHTANITRTLSLTLCMKLKWDKCFNSNIMIITTQFEFRSLWFFFVLQDKTTFIFSIEKLCLDAFNLTHLPLFKCYSSHGRTPSIMVKLCWVCWLFLFYFFFYCVRVSMCTCVKLMKRLLLLAWNPPSGQRAHSWDQPQQCTNAALIIWADTHSFIFSREHRSRYCRMFVSIYVHWSHKCSFTSTL